MSYTSPSPANIAANGNQTTFWIPARNLSAVKVTNVSVQVTISPANGLSPVTYVADKGVFNYTTGVWQVGTLLANEVKWLKLVTSVADIGLAPFTITSVISGDGVDSNNVNNTLVQTLTSVVCDPSAGAVDDPNSCNCVDVSLNDTACTHGTTEWRITEGSIVNSDTYTWDETTGKGRFSHIDITQDITFTYSIWCDSGGGFLQISGPATVTIPALAPDITFADHSADFIEGSTLTPEQVALLKAQPAYTGLTDEQIQAYCWEVMYNADGDLVGGWAHACEGTQDNRHMVFCSEVECTDPENECPSCPYTNMPVDVSAYIASVTNYTAEEGDVITVYHPGAISVYEYDGTQWVRNTCGCITFLNNAYPVSVTVTGDTTKTLTITLSDTTTLSTSWTDNDTNTTYRLEPATVGDMCYVRLINNQTNTIVSSVQVACTGEAAPCCCDCDVTLIPTLDGAVAETNCADIIWTGEGANAIWESRPVDGVEGDWAILDTGYHNGVYDNGCVGCLIRVRYTIDACERFSNTVEVKSCPCWMQVASTDDVQIFYREHENCNITTDSWVWQIRTNRNVWADVQTGDSEFDFTTWAGTAPGIALLATVNAVVDGSLGLRIEYVDNTDGCTKYTDIAYIPIP